MNKTGYLLTVGLLLAAAAAQAEDWPQWLGPDGASTWHATGIKTEFEPDELEQVWSLPCGVGYSGPAVAAGKVYLFDYQVTEGTIENNPSRPIKLQGQERLHCIDATTGKPIWTKGMPVEYYVSYPSGPRATPTVDGQHVYTLGTEGDLVCRNTANGEVVWQVNFLKEFGIKTPIWGHSSSPLVIDNLVYCMVGGEGTAIVAFDKATGKEAWRALSSSEPGYAAPTALEINGTTYVAAFHPAGVSILDPKQGTELWSKPIASKYGMSIAQPRLLGDKLFVTGYGSALMIDGATSDDPKAIWRSTSSRKGISCANSTPYLTTDTIFGCDSDSSEVMAVDATTSERLWTNQDVVLGEDGSSRDRHGTAFLVRHAASGRYFLFNEGGELMVADLTREGITLHGRTKIIEPTGEAFGRSVVWSHPAFAQGCVFARNDQEIVCVSLKE